MSRRLRHFALPLLWSVIKLSTVNQLGKLRDALRELPHVAHHVRCFTFSWWMDGVFHECKGYPAKHGTLLDMAFINRTALWERMRRQAGARIIYGGMGVYFKSHGVCYNKPFVCDAGEEAPEPQQAGPDNKGEDPRIKSPRDFTECCTEVVSRLTSLRGFRWECQITPMPAGVFEALKKLKDLRVLHTDIWYPRSFQYCE